jgi:hypothetical protein
MVILFFFEIASLMRVQVVVSKLTHRHTPHTHPTPHSHTYAQAKSYPYTHTHMPALKRWSRTPVPSTSGGCSSPGKFLENPTKIRFRRGSNLGSPTVLLRPGAAEASVTNWLSSKATVL